MTRGFRVSLPMVSRAVRPAALGAGYLACAGFVRQLCCCCCWCCCAHARAARTVWLLLILLLLFLLQVFFCGCDGGNGGIGMYVESFRCLLLLLLLLLLHRLLTSMCNFLPPKVFWIRPNMVVDCSSRM